MAAVIDGTVVQISEWKKYTWLRHGFSTRRGGVSTAYRGSGVMETDNDLNTGWTADDPAENVVENRRRLIAMVGGDQFSADSLITVRQVHSAQSLVIPNSAAQFTAADGRAALQADGLMTNVSGHLLGIQTADCVPILIVDPERRSVGAFHAGWRGTVERIVEHGVRQMSLEFGGGSDSFFAAIGPSIGACCYSVGDEVREAFRGEFRYGNDLFTIREKGASQTVNLDLWQANCQQLLDAGIPRTNISIVGECTGCCGTPGPRKYFSHRCEKGFTGRMMSAIGIR